MKKILVVLLIALFSIVVYPQVETRYSSLNLENIKFSLLSKIEKELNKTPNEYLKKKEKNYLKDKELPINFNDSTDVLTKIEVKLKKEKNQDIIIRIMRIQKKVSDRKDGKIEYFLHPGYVLFLRTLEREAEKKLEESKELIKSEKKKTDKNLEEIIEFIKITKKNLEGKITKDAQMEGNFEFLNHGFMEYGTGILKGTIRVAKYRLGEPSVMGFRRFSLPIYVFVSAKDTGSALGKSQETDMTDPANAEAKSQAEKNKEAFLELLDPLGGTVNFSCSQKLKIANSKFDLTHVYLFGNLGGKVTRENIAAEELGELTKINGFAAIGFLFDTGAWKEGKLSNVGKAYIQSSLGFLFIGKKQNKEVFNDNLKSVTLNWASEIGFYIKDEINLKISILKCLIHTSDANYEFLNRFYLKAGLAYSFN